MSKFFFPLISEAQHISIPGVFRYITIFKELFNGLGSCFLGPAAVGHSKGLQLGDLFEVDRKYGFLFKLFAGTNAAPVDLGEKPTDHMPLAVFLEKLKPIARQVNP